MISLFFNENRNHLLPLDIFYPTIWSIIFTIPNILKHTWITSSIIFKIIIESHKNEGRDLNHAISYVYILTSLVELHMFLISKAISLINEDFNKKAKLYLKIPVVGPIRLAQMNREHDFINAINQGMGDAEDALQNTSLHYMLMFDLYLDHKFIKLILDNGANIRHPNSCGITPIYLAYKHKNQEIIDYIADQLLLTEIIDLFEKGLLINGNNLVHDQIYNKRQLSTIFQITDIFATYMNMPLGLDNVYLQFLLLFILDSDLGKKEIATIQSIFSTCINTTSTSFESKLEERILSRFEALNIYAKDFTTYGLILGNRSFLKVIKTKSFFMGTTYRMTELVIASNHLKSLIGCKHPLERSITLHADHFISFTQEDKIFHSLRYSFFIEELIRLIKELDFQLGLRVSKKVNSYQELLAKSEIIEGQAHITRSMIP